MFTKSRKPALKKLKMQQAISIRREKSMEPIKKKSFSGSLDANVALISDVLGNSSDLVVRPFEIRNINLSAVILFIEGLSDTNTLERFVLNELFHFKPDQRTANKFFNEPVDLLNFRKIPVDQIEKTDKLHIAVTGLLSGDSILLLEDSSKVFIFNTKGWEKRGIEEPKSESVVRGPRNGFSETLRTNTAQIRLKLKDPNLRIKNITIGMRGNTDVAVIFIEHLTDDHIVEEVIRRIKKIEIDAVLDSGYIEQMIQDTKWSPFPLIQSTERPDKVVANLLEGKVAVLCDGSPFALIAPAVFAQFYHSPEDYYDRFLIATMIRFIRIISMIVALLAPSLYIAFSSFHPEMIPSRLVIAMAAGRSTVPFPSIVEAFLMEITIEILREASIRLPGPVGPTIGIVGALVVGQAAVEAGIVSPIMVIIVALTTIGSFASPNYSAAIALRMLRFPIMIIAAVFGLYGVMLLIILILIHLCSLKSFGVPYLSPLTPYRKGAFKDTFMRAPLQKMKK